MNLNSTKLTAPKAVSVVLGFTNKYNGMKYIYYECIVLPVAG